MGVVKKIGLTRLEEILPTFNADKINIIFHGGMYLDMIELSIPNGYTTYKIHPVDVDPRHSDDYVLMVLDILIKDKRTNIHQDIKTFYRSKAKPWLTLNQIVIGE